MAAQKKTVFVCFYSYSSSVKSVFLIFPYFLLDYCSKTDCLIELKGSDKRNYLKRTEEENTIIDCIIDFVRKDNNVCVCLRQHLFICSLTQQTFNEHLLCAKY